MRLLGLGGHVQSRPAPGRNPTFRLTYGKHDSIRLLSLLYRDRAAPMLERKWMIWEGYRKRSGLDAVPKEGFEPSRAYAHTALNRARLA
jgi:hypothetical protein